MTELARVSALPPCDPKAMKALKEFEEYLSHQPQVRIETEHHLHAGVYSRTVYIPKGVVATGVEIKCPTQLIMSGHARMTVGNEVVELKGYCVLEGGGRRKQIVYALEDTYFTMLFATDAKSVAEAEEEFTDEADRLQTRKELLCRE